MTIVPNNATGRVSVVVPSYNHARFVASCLRSIIKQSNPPAELLVIDDGSTDASPNIIAPVLNECPFPAELIVRENRGLCATLNQGLALTKGDYFSYLSSDDLWLADFLQARTTLLDSRRDAVLAYGHAYFVDEENNIIDSTADWAHYEDGDVRSMLLKTIAPMSPTVLHRRRALERFGWNEGSRLEDYELYLRLSSVGKFAFDSRIFSAWRLHEANASWNQRMMLEEHLSALRQMGPTLGLTNNELRKLEREVSFRRAEDFMRVGDKKSANRLLLENIGAASSPRLLARLAARLLLPYGLAKNRQEKKRRRKTEQFGKLIP
jgi:alpha-1,3-rhamnosyltransferase